MALRAYADGALFAENLGDEPSQVLALHGWGRRGSDFRQSLKGIPALAVDLPGFGASPPPPTVIGAEGYATAMTPLLGHLADPAVLLGHSFGGRVAVELAAAHPGRFSRLILTGVPLVRIRPPARPSAGFRALRALHKTGVISDDRMEEIRRKRGSADYRAATGVMRDILVKVINESYEPSLETIKSPIELIWGAEDAEVPIGVAERALEIVRNSGGTATLQVIDGVGHLLPLQSPESLRVPVERALRA
ncbi:MAG: alpha/beta hydrolase [Acidimicrobiia bacterium]